MLSQSQFSTIMTVNLVIRRPVTLVIDNNDHTHLTVSYYYSTWKYVLFKAHLLCLESYFYITGEFEKVDFQFAVQIVPWTTDKINKDMGIRIKSQGLGHTVLLFNVLCGLHRDPGGIYPLRTKTYIKNSLHYSPTSARKTPLRGKYIVTVFQFGLLGTYCHSRQTTNVPLPGWGGGKYCTYNLRSSPMLKRMQHQ